MAKSRISENELGAVDVCGCGSVHIHIGAISLRLTQGQFAAVAQMVAEAQTRLQEPPAAVASEAQVEESSACIH